MNAPCPNCGDPVRGSTHVHRCTLKTPPVVHCGCFYDGDAATVKHHASRDAFCAAQSHRIDAMALWRELRSLRERMAETRRRFVHASPPLLAILGPVEYALEIAEGWMARASKRAARDEESASR